VKEFIYAALASEAFKKYDIVIRDMADNEERVSLSKICAKREKYANMIVNEVGTKDAAREDALEFARRIIRVIDMTLLKNAVWVGDVSEA